MNDQRLDLTSLRNAITALADSLAVAGDHAWLDRQPQIVRNTLQAGVTQHFAVAFELCAKMLRRYIELNATNSGGPTLSISVTSSGLAARRA